MLVRLTGLACRSVGHSQRNARNRQVLPSLIVTIRAMTLTGPALATADIGVEADPDAIYRLVTDLPTLTSLAVEPVAMRWVKGDSARPGAVFRGKNRNGLRRWSTTCTVSDADPGRVFAFDVDFMGIPVSHWRYDIAPVEAGCSVTERMWDRRPGWFVGLGGLATGVSNRQEANGEHMRLTLERLKVRAEAG